MVDSLAPNRSEPRPQWARTHSRPFRLPERPASMRRIPLMLAVLILAAGIAAAPRHLASHIQTGQDFVHFESAHVRPVSMTPDGTRLLVVNTPDNRLSVFSLTGPTPARIAEIPVGLEPVAVSAR